jgi:putative transposase
MLSNGYVESFNARLRDALLDGEIFYALREAEVVIESWRRHDNTVRRTLRSASGHPRRRWCCPPSPPGPRRYADRPRPPHKPWRSGRR